MNRLSVVLCVALLATVCFAGPARAENAPKDRPPGVEDALERGFAMAQRQRWGLAIRYFGNAQQLAPTDAVVLFNLALANDRASGRNLIAAAWYRAFLAVAPTAPNAEKVRTRVVDLEIEGEAIVLDMLDTAINVATQLQGASRVIALARIAGAQAVSGDLPSAQQTAAQLGNEPQAAWAQARIAAAHATKGNATAGIALARQIPHRRARDWALAEVAVIQAIQKDFAAAMQTASSAAPGPDRDFAFSRLAALQAMAGDAGGANKSADEISESAAGFRLVANTAAAIPMSKSELPWIAEKARAYLGTALAEAQKLKNIDARQVALLQIVRARAGTRDFKGAAEAQALIASPRFKHLAAASIARANGELAVAELHHWSALAAQAAASPTMGDVAAMLEQAKTGEPAETVKLITGAAEERARFLEALRSAAR